MLNKKKLSLFNILNITGIILFSIAVLYPFWNTFVLSFSDASQASSLGVNLWPETWTTTAYRYIFSYSDVGTAYLNTIFRTVVGTTIIVTITILAAYPLSRKDLPYRNMITTIFLIAMFFSGGMIPDYLLVKNLGLLDTRLALLLPSAVNVFNIVIMRNYFMTIDKGIEESALMDGANYFTILMRIIIPLSKPVIVTIALWSAVFHWNEWFHAMVYIRDSGKDVLQTIVRSMLVDMSVQDEATQVSGVGQNRDLLLSNVRAATVMVSIGPIIFVYPFAQKYFIKGIMIGSLKG